MTAIPYIQARPSSTRRYTLPLVAALLTLVLMGSFLFWQGTTPAARPNPNGGAYQEGTATPTAPQGDTHTIDTTRITFENQTWNNSGPAALAVARGDAAQHQGAGGG